VPNDGTNASNENYFRPLAGTPRQRATQLPVMLDVDPSIDYMLGHLYTGEWRRHALRVSANNMPNNWYGVRDRDQSGRRFRFFNNDCEHTLGSPSSQVDRTGPFGGSNEGNFIFSNPQWFQRNWMRNAEYRVRFGDHVQKHFFNGGALTLEANTNRFIAKSSQSPKPSRLLRALGRCIQTTQPLGERDWTNAIAFCLNWFLPRAEHCAGAVARR